MYFRVTQDIHQWQNSYTCFAGFNADRFPNNEITSVHGYQRSESNLYFEQLCLSVSDQNAQFSGVILKGGAIKRCHGMSRAITELYKNMGRYTRFYEDLFYICKMHRVGFAQQAYIPTNKIKMKGTSSHAFKFKERLKTTFMKTLN